MKNNVKTGLVLGFAVIVLFLSGVLPGVGGGLVNGLSGEAGILQLQPDGSYVEIPLRTATSLAVWKVNSVDVAEGDYIYWRFWLNVKAEGFDGEVTKVRFRLWQEIAGGLSDWQAGTEGTSGGPDTMPSEVWNQVALPAGQVVTVPMKYRDTWLGDENADHLAPFTELSADESHVIRDRRLEVCKPVNWPEGVTVWTAYCEVLEIEWTWTENGVQKTSTFLPEPSVISYTFTVEKTSGSATATLESESSH